MSEFVKVPVVAIYTNETLRSEGIINNPDLSDSNSDKLYYATKYSDLYGCQVGVPNVYATYFFSYNSDADIAILQISKNNMFTMNVIKGSPYYDIYIVKVTLDSSGLNQNIWPLYSNYDIALNAFVNFVPPASSYPITYRMTNATHSGPSEAAVGDNVEVPLSFPEGYGIVNASTDAYVTNNGVLIPSQYANGKLSFTMPDPS